MIIVNLVAEYTMKIELCTECGLHEAQHLTHRCGRNPTVTNLCCVCHIKNGGIPADWHSQCMKAAAIRLATKEN